MQIKATRGTVEVTFNTAGGYLHGALAAAMVSTPTLRQELYDVVAAAADSLHAVLDRRGFDVEVPNRNDAGDMRPATDAEVAETTARLLTKYSGALRKLGDDNGAA